MYYSGFGYLLLLSVCCYSASAVIFLLPQIQPPVLQEGRSIQLVCGVNVTQMDLADIESLEWMRFRGDVIERIDQPEKVNIGIVKNSEIYSKTLTIRDIRESDAGIYTCELWTKDDDAYFDIYLEVQPKSNFAIGGDEDHQYLV